jgi:hypothetical protein
MQQAVMEEEAAYEPPSLKYDDAFPALPESVTSASPTVNQLGQWNNKMRIGSSVVTQVSSFVMPDCTAVSRKYVSDEI